MRLEQFFCKFGSKYYICELFDIATLQFERQVWHESIFNQRRVGKITLILFERAKVYLAYFLLGVGYLNVGLLKRLSKEVTKTFYFIQLTIFL